MKEIILVIQKGGKVKILAEGQAGQGTAEFTEKLAKDLGQIEERHKGTHHAVHGEKQQQSLGTG
jgi:hypothetical protein